MKKDRTQSGLLCIGKGQKTINFTGGKLIVFGVFMFLLAGVWTTVSRETSASTAPVKSSAASGRAPVPSATVQVMTSVDLPNDEKFDPKTCRPNTNAQSRKGLSDDYGNKTYDYSILSNVPGLSNEGNASDAPVLKTVIKSSKKGRQEMKPEDQFVAVFVMPSLGPVGEAYMRNDFGEIIKLPKEAKKLPFNYPSLYFDVSASPKLTPYAKDNEAEFDIDKVSNENHEMEWLDVTIRLHPYCQTKEGEIVECSMKCENNELTCNAPLVVLGILPNNTLSGTRESLPSQISGAFADLASLSLPFYASSNFGTRSEAATKGLTVLFDNLFPPKTVTYQHAYIVSPTSFGWNLRNQARNGESKNPSIMGMHRGAAVLQARTDVKYIGVRYYALSRWNKPPNKYSDKFDLRIDNTCMSIPALPPPPTDYAKLKNLDSFPFLIPKAEVCKILQIAGSSCADDKCEKKADGSYKDDYCALIDPAANSGVETTPDKKFVRRSSLEKYLGLVKPEKEKEEKEEKKKP